MACHCVNELRRNLGHASAFPSYLPFALMGNHCALPTTMQRERQVSLSVLSLLLFRYSVAVTLNIGKDPNPHGAFLSLLLTVSLPNPLKMAPEDWGTLQSTRKCVLWIAEESEGSCQKSGHVLQS